MRHELLFVVRLRIFQVMMLMNLVVNLLLKRLVIDDGWIDDYFVFLLLLLLLLLLLVLLRLLLLLLIIFVIVLVMDEIVVVVLLVFVFHLVLSPYPITVTRLVPPGDWLSKKKSFGRKNRVRHLAPLKITSHHPHDVWRSHSDVISSRCHLLFLLPGDV